MAFTKITEESVSEWLCANPRLAQDDHNKDMMCWYVDYMAKKGRESEISIESLSAFCSANAGSLHWLRDENEIQNAAQAAAQAEAARIAALPPEPKQPERLRGLSARERLASIGVETSGRVNHASATAENERLAASVRKAQQQAAQIKAEQDRRKAIQAARETVVFRANGRVDYAGTADARRRALAALSVSE
jgi:hypothetical protein